MDYKGFSAGGKLPAPVPSERRTSTGRLTASAYLLSLPLWGQVLSLPHLRGSHSPWIIDNYPLAAINNETVDCSLIQKFFYAGFYTVWVSFISLSEKLDA